MKKIFISMLCLIAIALFTLVSIPLYGKKQLQKNEYVSTEGQSLFAQNVNYQGHSYTRKDNIYTFLCLGIDLRDISAGENASSVGQADGILLVILDANTKQIHAVSYPRDIMTEDNVQTTLVYSYAGGEVDGCIAMEETVSAKLYNLPINGYLSMKLKDIPRFNDMVDGVTVTVLEDLSMLNPNFVEGNDVHLIGQDAVDYLHARNIYQANSSLSRTKRHSQYIHAYCQAFVKKWAKSPLLPLKMWKEIKTTCDTNLTFAELCYLGISYRHFTVDDMDLSTIDVNVEKNSYFEEYHIDKHLLQQKLLDILYVEDVPRN